MEGLEAWFISDKPRSKEIEIGGVKHTVEYTDVPWSVYFEAMSDKTLDNARKADLMASRVVKKIDGKPLDGSLKTTDGMAMTWDNLDVFHRLILTSMVQDSMKPRDLKNSDGASPS
jgi:hypothetical protein